MKTILKQDAYRAARGGWSRLLELRCRECNTVLTRYQKDGPGPLRRLYLARFVPLAKSTAFLQCKKCKETIGTAIIYKKENRKAYRLYQDAVVKKIVRSS